MNPSTPQQLSLNVHLSDDATFDNYFVSPDTSNFLALQAVRELVVAVPTEPFIYLWGPEGAGISHLLQAACHQATINQLRSQYLPLEELAGFAPTQLLDGLEELDVRIVVSQVADTLRIDKRDELLPANNQPQDKFGVKISCLEETDTAPLAQVAQQIEFLVGKKLRRVVVK